MYVDAYDWVMAEHHQPLDVVISVFEERDGETVAIDRVRYAVPGGALINWLLVRHDVARIFAYRTEKRLETLRPDALVLTEPNSFPETDAITKLGRKLCAPIELVSTRQFLLPRDEFRVWAGGQKQLLMENHYRRMRKQ